MNETLGRLKSPYGFLIQVLFSNLLLMQLTHALVKNSRDIFVSLSHFSLFNNWAGLLNKKVRG